MNRMLRAVSSAAITLGTLVGVATAHAETLRVSLFTPPSHVFNQALAAWGEELKAKSGGELTLEFFPAGQLAPPPRQYDLLRSGGADITVLLQSATPGRFPMSELPGLPLKQPSAGNSAEIMSRRYTELAPEFLASEYEGEKILWMAVSPQLHTFLAKTEPLGLEAFKGLRIRYAGAISQKIVEAFGATPVPVPPAETADAMGKGVVDGTMFTYEGLQSFDVGPVTKYATEPGLSSQTFTFLMSKAAYDRLSPEVQKLVDDSIGPDRAAWFGALMDKAEEKGRQYVIDGGAKITTLPEAEQAKLADNLSAVIDGMVAAVEGAGKPAKAFLDAYTK